MCSQNLKQVPQNFMKFVHVDDVTLTSQLTTPYRKINNAIENITNYRVTSPSNYCCQISIIVRERPGTSVMIHFFSFFKARTRSPLYFFTLKFVYADVAVRYLNYLNQCIVHFGTTWYLGILVLVWQKVNEALLCQHLPVSSWNSDTEIRYERSSRLMKKPIIPWKDTNKTTVNCL